MLHKKHNSVITLAILLTLVGVSKPAKAFLLAQSDTAPSTFTVPEELSEDATIKIAASNSTDSIGNSLKESFTAKYPQAEVEIEAQDSGIALNSVAEGQADLAAIGRNLTADEQARGFTSVPISREKIAIVISKNNPYDGNLTIDQFAQIFRGEITDWSEIGGEPGKIELVDLPDTNDTRQAFPNYPVFQAAEFSTGATATQLEQDSTEAMVEQLGKNSISYAVANDVINRDDVKIVTMHTTQPDDSRYPFSQPFNLVYQGIPSEAAQAYLAFANAEGGQEVVANRIGSVSTATVAAIATGVAADAALDRGSSSPDSPEVADPDAVVIDSDADVDAEIADPDAVVIDPDADVDAEIADPDAVADADADAEIADPDAVVDADADAEIADPDAVVDADVDAEVADPDAVVIDPDADAEIADPRRSSRCRCGC